MTCCGWCKTTDQLWTFKYCHRCHAVLYCSEACVTAHWWEHKAACGRPLAISETPSSNPWADFASVHPYSTDAIRLLTSGNPGLPSPSVGLKISVHSPFTRIGQNTWLHDRPEIDVYRLLVDSFRLYLRDKLDFENVVDLDEDGITGGVDCKLKGLREFLKLAAKHPRLLPPWWSFEKKVRCCDLAMEDRQWHSLHHPVRSLSLSDHYGDERLPLQLRLFAEEVVGRGPGGDTGFEVLIRLMEWEQGSRQGYIHEVEDMVCEV